MAGPLRFDYQPLPTFVPFHLDTEYECALAGGYGSGKSVALTADAIELGLNQPGSEILVCRRTIPSLRDTTEKIFVNHLPPDFFAACKTSRMGGHYESIQFPNGSIYYFRGLDDWTKLKSMSVAAIYYDEADEIDPDTYEGLLSRVRQRIPTAEARALNAPKITRRKIRLAFNPAGHNWIWQRFIGPNKREYTSWYKSTSLDNPYNPPDYIRSLLAMPTPWVKRYVLCNFDDFGGQIYQTWSYDSHVIQPYRGFSSPYHYPEGFFLMGMDPGTRDPTAGVWCFYDRDKHRLVAVAQYQQDSLAAPKHAAAWRKIEAQHNMRVRRRIGDPHAVTVRDRGSNISLSDIYRKLGYHFDLGPTVEQTRIFALGTLIEQGRFVVTTDCAESLDDDGTSLFARIRDYQWKDLTPSQLKQGVDAPEKPLKRNTHLVECAQFCASHHLSTPKVSPVEAKSDRHAESIEINRAIRRQLRAGRIATNDHALGSMNL